MLFQISRIKPISVLLLCMMITFLCGCINDQEEESHTEQVTHSPGLVEVMVTEVVDGDTITISGGERVRLIGIDAPETDEEYYQESKTYLTKQILYQEIKLESDVTDKDKYGRSLRYIWFDGEFINAQIVKNGLAIAKQFDPDIRYQHLIADAEKEAMEKKVMMWSAVPIQESYSFNTDTLGLEVISYQDASKYIGEIKTVEGTIVGTYKHTNTDSSIIFLNFHDPYIGYFTALIWSDDWDKFPESPDIFYKNKKVRVTGKIEEHKGSPEIIVNDIDQIEVVGTSE